MERNLKANVGQVIERAMRHLVYVYDPGLYAWRLRTATPPYANDPSYVTFKAGDARGAAVGDAVCVGGDATSPTTRRRDWEEPDDNDVALLYTAFRETVTRIVAEEAPYTKLVFDKAHGAPAAFGNGAECFVVWIDMSGVRGVYSMVVGQEVDEDALRHRLRNGCRRIGAWVMGKEGRRP